MSTSAHLHEGLARSRNEIDQQMCAIACRDTQVDELRAAFANSEQSKERLYHEAASHVERLKAEHQQDVAHMTNAWRGECVLLEQARATAEDLARRSAEHAAMADVDKQMFENEASEHFAAQHKMWRHSEQQHADTKDYYFKMQELANDRLLLAEDESNIAASCEQRADAMTTE